MSPVHRVPQGLAPVTPAGRLTRAVALELAHQLIHHPPTRSQEDMLARADLARRSAQTLKDLPEAVQAVLLDRWDEAVDMRPDWSRAFREALEDTPREEWGLLLGTLAAEAGTYGFLDEAYND